MLHVGDSAPLSMVLTKEDGTTTTLAEYAGSWIVVYFYPRDNTPGCTIEAAGFRDIQGELAKRTAVVLGVSKDSCASHQKFIDKKELNFTLIADTDHALMDAFGAWQKKKLAGREYMGTVRMTFLLDPTGKVAHVWEKVKPVAHPAEVLAVLDELQA